MTTATHTVSHEDLSYVEDLLCQVKTVDFPVLGDMLAHVLDAGGKRLRPVLALVSGGVNHYDMDAIVPFAASVELLHTATLVHDDVIDNSTTRRRRPTANSLYHNGATVMMGDYMFAHAAELVTRTNNMRVIKLFARTLMAMAYGEAAQDLTAYNYSQTINDYFKRIGGKTAALFATATEGGALLSHAPEDVVEGLRVYGHNLGMAFQVVDDVLDYTGDEEVMGKPVGSDLMQGTLTLPSLILIERRPRDNPIKEYFAGRRQAENLRLAIEMVREGDICGESMAIARDFHTRALEGLRPLGNTEAKAALVGLAEYVVSRQH